MTHIKHKQLDCVLSHVKGHLVAAEYLCNRNV